MLCGLDFSLDLLCCNASGQELVRDRDSRTIRSTLNLNPGSSKSRVLRLFGAQEPNMGDQSRLQWL